MWTYNTYIYFWNISFAWWRLFRMSVLYFCMCPLCQAYNHPLLQPQCQWSFVCSEYVFFKPTMENSLPIDRPPPLCLIMFGFTKDDPSIHHYIMILLFVLRISGKLFFDSGVFNYMDQLGSVVISGYVNIVARNETAVHFSGLAFLLADNIFSTR